MPDAPVDALRRAVQDLHRCKAVFVRAVHVGQAFDGMPAWNGLVSIFDLADHPTSSRAYAWSYETGGGAARCFTAILRQGAVDSPKAAVRASLRSKAPH
jgi:hypothetical protein